MKKRKGKRNEIPITGILVGVIAVLFVCAVVLGCMVFWKTESHQADLQKHALQQEEVKLQTDMQSETDQNEVLKSADTQAEILTEDETEEETEEQTEVLTESLIHMFMETELAAEETETESSVRIPVVAIDPGHQGSWVDMSEKEPNAPGSTEMKQKATVGTQGRFSGKAEFELNLEVSLLLRDILEERGYRVIMTREDHDTAISNSERALMAYNEGGDIYVRIHANGSDDSSVSGALAMVPSSSNPYVGYLAEDSYLLAQHILSGYCESAQFKSLGIQHYDNMTGINWSKIPVMILEMGFMTNETDDLRMANTEVQYMMAQGIANGIEAYFEEKGMFSPADAEKKNTPEAQAQMDLLFEQLGETYLYAAMDRGETWAVSISDISTGAAGNINGDQRMKSASVIKAFIMAAIYDRVCYPSSEERRIQIYEAYDGELKQLITDMITVSDNSASNTLIERLGGGNVQEGMAVVNQYCQENGYTNTWLGRRFLESDPTDDNYTSVNDCCRLLKSIYEGKCVNGEASRKMLEYLRNQTRTGKIPAGLSGTGAVTYNKTGELAGEYGDYVENDIAIVETGESVYVLCIMTENLNDNGQARTLISEISGMVYNSSL